MTAKIQEVPIDPGQIFLDAGLAWIAPIPSEFGPGDAPGKINSELVLLEDQRPLGPGHATHEAIRKIGGGAYSHWFDCLYFSTSDGTDPRTNRRQYRMLVALSSSDHLADEPLPINLRHRDAAEIDTDVNYAIMVAKGYLTQFKMLNLTLSGLRLLELGPGVNFGPQLILASQGVTVTLADRYLSEWNDDYHPRFYEALLRAWDGPSDTLQQVVTTRNYGATLATTAESAENLSSLPDSSFDIVVSNAVLEHVYDLDQVVAELSRVTVLNGFNIHQVDFRDHNNFGNPLEFLLIEDGEYSEQFGRSFGERGNRLRPSECEASFLSAGLSVYISHSGTLAGEDYLKDFIPRLRASHSSYRNWPDQGLRPIGVTFIFQNTRRDDIRERGRRFKSELSALRGRL